MEGAAEGEEEAECFFVGTGGVGGLIQAILGRSVPGACAVCLSVYTLSQN